MEETDYEKDLRIDPEALDVEWLRQPALFHKYAQAEADARMRADGMKELVEIVMAEEVDAARQRLGGPGNKPTVDQVKGAAQQTQRYRKALQDYLDAQHEKDMVTAAVRAMDQKKAALENLVRLHGQDYFSGPSVPRDIGAEFRKRVEEKGRATARDMTVGRLNAEAAAPRRRRQ